MRTLNKALCLVLAVVMCFGMLAIGANAAFDDAAKITANYKEAVEVMTGIKVIDGKDGNLFDPQGSLTREQAAKIVVYVVLGPDNAAKVSAVDSRFTDVAGRWSAGYVEYAANLGILEGVGDNKFNPTGTLSTAAFGKMLLCSLGYDAAIQGYSGDGWAIAVASDMVSAGLTDDSITVSAATTCTREMACQLAYKALTATMVKYDQKGTSVTINGAVIATGASSAEPVERKTGTNYDGTAETGSTAGCGTQQMCEKYFGKLALTKGTADAFGAPAEKWMNGTTEIGTYASSPVATFTLATKAADVAKALSGYKLQNAAASATYKIDNITTIATTGFSTAATIVAANNTDSALDVATTTAETTAKAIADETAHGKVVKVYADSSTKIVTKIVEITYSVGKISNVTTSATGTTYVIGNSVASGVDYKDADADDTVVLNGAVAKGDVVTYVQPTGGDLYIYPTTKTTGILSSVTSVGTAVIGGTTYVLAAGVTGFDSGTFAASTKEAVYFIDQFGYVVLTTATAASGDFAYVVNTYGKLTTDVNGSVPTAQVKVVLADGTVATYDLKLKKLVAATAASALKVWNATQFDAYTGAAGDYIIDGTPYCVFSAASGADVVATNVEKALKHTAVGYTLVDKVIAVEPIVVASDSMTPGTNYTADATALGYGVTSEVISSATVLVGSASKYVVYNSVKDTAVVFTGNYGLPSGTSGIAGTVVAKASAATSATASVIFVTSSTIGASAASDYVYIDHTAYSTGLTATGANKFVYEGVKADGSKIALSKTSALTASGLYKYNTDETVGDVICQTSNTTLTGTPACYVYDATLAVDGDMLGAASNFYNITSDTKVVYIKSELSAIHENGGYVVLAVVNGDVTNNVAAIFITVD